MKFKKKYLLGVLLIILVAVGCAQAGTMEEEAVLDEGQDVASAGEADVDEEDADTDGGQALLNEEGDPIPLATYPLENDQLVGDSIDAQHEAVWERFSEIIPSEFRPEIESFQPIDGSSGIDGTMFATDDPTVWVVQLDVMEAVSQKDLERTMIHEFAHLLTLRPSQIPPVEESADTDYETLYQETKASCEIFFQSEGCPTTESYLYAFIDAFWTDLLPDDVEELDSSDEAGEVRFEEFPGRFVTEYAGTQPTEDIAESFAEYVLADTLPTGDSEAEEKIRFFDDYPELQQIREAIRQANPAES